MKLLILGASARAAAFSARRAGLVPTGIDLFADRDLASIARAISISPADYPFGLAALADEGPPGPWIYTGALENHPELIDRIAQRRPLWGIGGATLRAVREPIAVVETLRRAGLPCPDVRLSPNGLPRDGSWLVKPIASAGGQGIHPLRSGEETLSRPSYYQERIAGPSLSAIFLGVRSGAALAGVTRQWIGRPGSEFAYVGSIGPWPVSDPETRRIRALGDTLARAFGLIGLFGVDFILRDGFPWPVEINPRYTASVEVLELALGRAILDDHRFACESGELSATNTIPKPREIESSRVACPRLRGHVRGPRTCPRRRGHATRNLSHQDKFDAFSSSKSEPPALGRNPMVGKLILFATETIRVPGLDPGPIETGPPFVVPRFGDIPQAGAVIEAGWPVMTLFATGTDEAMCRRRLERERSGWETRLRGS